MPRNLIRRALFALSLTASVFGSFANADDKPSRLLYVAEPGIRNYLEYGGHGLLVFDMDRGFAFVKRIKTSGLDNEGKPDNVKGVCACARTGRIYVVTTKTLTCLDLETEKILWERPYLGGCDRMAIAPDGSNLYVPSFESDHWHVVAGDDGHIIAKIVPKSGSHNTVYGLDGKHAYLAGLKSSFLTVADTSTHTVSKTVGPFSASIRPFTVDGRQQKCYVNVNALLGFEIGDLTTGKKLARIEVTGFSPGPVKRHGCPSHGIGLTPDEKEVWVVDGYNKQVHIFDNTVSPPKQVASVLLRDEPGWITFSLDGKTAMLSTGEMIDTGTRKIVAALKDENGGIVMSEKMVEIQFQNGKPVRNGDQFGLGRVGAPAEK
jgi:DNA-binding beta-propeller fold protein YncE